MKLEQIKKDFNNAAISYDKNAVVQKQTANQLLHRISFANILPINILDIGAGTGFLSQQLKDHFPSSNIVCLDIAEEMLSINKNKTKNNDNHYICADMHFLPFKDKSFDLVVSNLTLQWSLDIGQVLAQINRVLADDGLVFFSVMADGSLIELKESFNLVRPDQKFHQFLDIEQTTDQLKNAGLNQIVLDEQVFILEYPNIKLILKDLKNIGAKNKVSLDNKGLLGKNKWQIFSKNYQKFQTNGNYPASFRIIYAHAFRTKVAPHPLRGAQKIAINHIN